MGENLNKAIGLRIRTLRGERTQEWLAGSTKLSVMSIRRIENGEKELTAGELFIFAHHLNTTTSYILGEESEPYVPAEKELASGYGNRIKQARTKKGLSRAELGERLNVSSDVILRWENEQQKPNRDQMRLLSKHTETHFRILFPDIEDEPEPLTYEGAIALLTKEHEDLLRLRHQCMVLNARLEELEGKMFKDEDEKNLVESFRKLGILRRYYVLYMVTSDEQYAEEMRKIARSSLPLKEAEKVEAQIRVLKRQTHP